MFPNQQQGPKPVSQYVNINPDAGANPTPTPPINPYPSQPEKVSFTPDKRSEKNKNIFILILALATIIFVGLFVWKFLDWSSLNGKVDKLVSEQVAEKELAIKENYDAEIAELDKKPFEHFLGPADYGELRFDYPRTWSLFVAKDATATTNDNRIYEAYMHPYSIGPITSDSILALRIYILNRSYDSIVQEYNSYVQSGVLEHNIITINNGNNNAALYSGTTGGKNIKTIIFKVRSQTIQLWTDAADNFGSDFDKIVNTITFNE